MSCAAISVGCLRAGEPCPGAWWPELRCLAFRLLVRREKQGRNLPHSSGLLTLRDSAITILMENIVIFLFTCKTSGSAAQARLLDAVRLIHVGDGALHPPALGIPP